MPYNGTYRIDEQSTARQLRAHLLEYQRVGRGALSVEGSEGLLKAGRLMVVLLGLSFTEGLGSRDGAG